MNFSDASLYIVKSSLKYSDVVTEEELETHVERIRRQGRDDALVEAKAAEKGLPKSMWDTVSAFANTEGGLIILGLDERRGFAPTEGFDPNRVVEQVIAGASMKDVLTRLGGQPGLRWDEPVLRGDGWFASPSSKGAGWEIEVVTDPEEDEGENLCFDKRHLADYAWRIAQALEQRYGPPYGMITDNDGFLKRLFQVGEYGVEVCTTGFRTVTVEIGSFETLAQYWCW